VFAVSIDWKPRLSPEQIIQIIQQDTYVRNLAGYSSEKCICISDNRAMGKHTQSTDAKIIARIMHKRNGWVFTPSDFVDLGGRGTVDKVLSRHSKAGTIRKLARGLYDYPIQHPTLGVLSPTTDAIAKALAGRDATRLQPAGGYAANLLGLSDQVPMKVVFLTDGATRNVRVGQQHIVLKRTTPKNMATAGRVSGLVVQALRHLGQQHVDDKIITRLRQRLTAADKQQLLKDLVYAPTWVADVMRQVARPE
jgi:hypothetical protein